MASYVSARPTLRDPRELRSWVDQMVSYVSARPTLRDPRELRSWVDQMVSYGAGKRFLTDCIEYSPARRTGQGVWWNRPLLRDSVRRLIRDDEAAW